MSGVNGAATPHYLPAPPGFKQGIPKDSGASEPQPENSKMAERSADPVPLVRAQNVRSQSAGAPMYREQTFNPGQQQGALFPVHTIVVQPNQQSKRGNYSKAAAAAMNRGRAPPPATYFIQHRRATAEPLPIIDEGPTVKQHLQEQQKQHLIQMKAKERLVQEGRHYTAEEMHNPNGTSSPTTAQPPPTASIIRTESGQVLKTFTVQTINSSSGPIIITGARQMPPPAQHPKRPPTQRVIAPADVAASRPVAPRSRVATTSVPGHNRKLNVIVSPGVATSFTTAAQKQQLATAPYVVSTQPLPPTSAQPSNLQFVQPVQQQLSQPVVQLAPKPRPQKTIVQSSGIPRTASLESMQRKAQIQPLRRNTSDPNAPSEFKVVTTVVPVTTPSVMAKPPHRAILKAKRESPPTSKMSELPLAILEGEEEELAREQEAKKQAEREAFERHVKELKEREQALLDQQDREAKEKERKRFEQRHREQQRILDQQIQQEMKLQELKKKEKETEERRRAELELKLKQKQEQERKEMEAMQMAEEKRIQQKRQEAEYYPEKDPDPILPQAPATQIVHHTGYALSMDELMSTASLEDSWNFDAMDPNDQNFMEPDPFAHFDQGTLYNDQQQMGFESFDNFNSGFPETMTGEQQLMSQEPGPSSLLDHISIMDDMFNISDSKEDPLSKLLSDPLIGFPDVFSNGFPDLGADLGGALMEPSTSSTVNKEPERAESPDIGLSLVDWVMNDDHVDDDGDTLLKLRDERLESTASEYMNVCADVDFSFDIGPTHGSETTAIEERPPVENVVATPEPPPPMPTIYAPDPIPPPQVMIPIATSAPSQEIVPVPVQMPEKPPSRLPTPEIAPPARTRRKARSPKENEKATEPAPRARDRRRNEDKQTKQKKAEMDAIEKEKEARQIEADRERVRQIMMMEEKAIQAEKEAEALLKGPNLPKKKSRSSARNRAQRSAAGSPGKISTPAPKLPQDSPPPQPPPQSAPTTEEPGRLPPIESIDLQATMPTEVPQNYDWTHHLHTNQDGCITTMAEPQSMITSALPEAPIVSSYYDPNQQPAEPAMDPSQFGHEFAPQVAEQMNFNQQLDFPADFMEQFPDTFAADYPQQWFDGPIEQYFPELGDDFSTLEPFPRPGRPVSEDAGKEYYEGKDTMEEGNSEQKPRARRSNSFTSGIQPEVQEAVLTEPSFVPDPYGNVLPLPQVNHKELDEAIASMFTEERHTQRYRHAMEKAILEGDDERLGAILSEIEAVELCQNYSHVPTEFLFRLLENPHETLSAEELLTLRDDHGVDISEQLRVEDTNVGIEIPQEMLNNPDPETLGDYEWKKLLYQTFLLFDEDEKEEELAYMEEQVYVADVAWEKHFACKLKVLKDGLTNMLYTNGAMVDEISRVAGKLIVTNEERKVLARRLCHHQRNYIRRLQTAAKRRSAAEKRRKEMAAAGKVLPPIPAKKETQDRSRSNSASHKKKPSTATPTKKAAATNASKKKRGRPVSKKLPKMVKTAMTSPSPKKKGRTLSVSSTKSNTSPRKRDRTESQNSKERKKVKLPAARPTQLLVTPIAPPPEVVKKETTPIITQVNMAEVLRRVERGCKILESIWAKEEEEKSKKKKRTPSVSKSETMKEEIKEQPKDTGEEKKKKDKPKRARSMKGYAYEEVVEKEPEKAPEVEFDPDAPIGLRKASRRSALLLNFSEVSPRDTPEPDELEVDKQPRKRGRPRAKITKEPKPAKERKPRKALRLRATAEIPDEVEPSEPSSPRSTTESMSSARSEQDIAVLDSPATSNGDGDQQDTTTSPDTPVSDVSEDKDGRRMRPRRTTLTKSDEIVSEDETPKKKRRIRTESTPTRQSTRRKS